MENKFKCLNLADWTAKKAIIPLVLASHLLKRESAVCSTHSYVLNFGHEDLNWLSCLFYWHTDRRKGWSTFPAHAMGELPYGSQPTATTCVLWSCRLKWCFTPALAVKGAWYTAFCRCPTAMPCWWDLTIPKQLSMAVTARVICLCACVRYWPGLGLVNECVTCFN